MCPQHRQPVPRPLNTPTHHKESGTVLYSYRHSLHISHTDGHNALGDPKKVLLFPPNISLCRHFVAPLSSLSPLSPLSPFMKDIRYSGRREEGAPHQPTPPLISGAGEEEEEEARWIEEKAGEQIKLGRGANLRKRGHNGNLTQELRV